MIPISKALKIKQTLNNIKLPAEQWLWLSRQMVCFRYQRSTAQIQSSANFMSPIYCQLNRRDENKNEYENTFLKLKMFLPFQDCKCEDCQKKKEQGESPGLVVMGGGSCSEGREFESRRRILDGIKKKNKHYNNFLQNVSIN